VHGTGALKNDTEALGFIQSFPNNTNWHFVDLPLGSTSYPQTSVFISSDDVVHALGFCIKVLEGNDTTLSKKIALRVVVHVVGDIHQPLHCASGYYKVSSKNKPTLERDPQDAVPFKNFTDRGGNELRFGTGRIDELHGLWDGALVELDAGGTGSYIDLTEVLKDAAATTQVNDAGDFHNWPAQWAGESVKLADAAYNDLTLGKAKLDSAKTRLESIQLGFKNGIDSYEDTQKDVALQQMTKASIRLANLLNALLK
jgi:hypothetical protein